MSDPIKLPHPLPGTRVPFQKKATFKIEATVDVMWPEGVPFDEDKAASMAGNFIERLFVESVGLQVLCDQCHQDKTQEERTRQ